MLQDVSKSAMTALKSIEVDVFTSARSSLGHGASLDIQKQLFTQPNTLSHKVELEII